MHRNIVLAVLLSISSALASKDNLYLYRTLEDDGGSPIIDYYTPNEPNYRPDFLYQEDFPYHRVVEFYSHLCPHCQRFAPHYIEFGQKFNELTEEHSTGHYANLKVKFYAISCYAHHPICKQEKIRGYPTVRIYKANSTEGTKINHYELHPETLVKKLGVEAVSDNWKAKDEETHSAVEEAKQQYAAEEEKPPFMARRQEELFGDAYLSFYTTMKTAVFLDDSGTLDEDKEKKKTLRNFLVLLQRVLPPWRIHGLLDALLGKPEKVGFQNNVASESTWMSILEEHPPLTTEYSPACQLHDSPYTCGLWTLFHIMTVGVVEFNARIVNEDANRFVILNVNQVSDLIKFFVQHFLLCDACRNHFLEEYDACKYDRCNRFPPKESTGELKDWKQLPFWLLETHNGVNVRLQAERANGATISSEQEQKVMWPPVKDCPRCWLEEKGAASAKHYNETVVYEYLRFTYWPHDSHSIEAKEEILRMEKSPDTTKRSGRASQFLGDGNPYIQNITFITKEVQYSAMTMLVMVIFLWNKRRIRQKMEERTL